MSVDKVKEDTLAVVSTSGRSLSFINIESGEKIADLTNLVAEPHEICYDKSRDLLYISHTYRGGDYVNIQRRGHEISVVDPIKKKFIGVLYLSLECAPHGLAIDEYEDILYTSCEQLDGSRSGGLLGIDLKTYKIVKSIESGHKSHWFCLTQNGKKAFTMNKEASFISVLDLENERLAAKIGTPGSEEACLSNDGELLFIATPSCKFGGRRCAGGIIVISTKLELHRHFIETDSSVSSVHITSTDKMVVAKYDSVVGQGIDKPSMKQGKIGVFDLLKDAWVGEIDVGICPLTIRSSKLGDTVFVANLFSGRVSVIDMNALRVIKTLDVDVKRPMNGSLLQGAHGMALLPPFPSSTHPSIRRDDQSTGEQKDQAFPTQQPIRGRQRKRTLSIHFLKELTSKGLFRRAGPS